MSWHTSPMVAFDLESTGTDPETARIVTASVCHIDPRNGRDGITTDHARQHGTNPEIAVYEIEQALQSAWVENTPVVIFNAPYDLTVLDRELRRHNDGIGIDGHGPVVDPLVLDKHTDRYRKGSRKLVDTCAHYGIVLDDAHTAAADALAAARLAWALVNRYPDELGDLHELQPLQANSFAEQAASFADYLRRRKQTDGEDQASIDAIAINRDWPLIPHQPVEEVA